MPDRNRDTNPETSPRSIGLPERTLNIGTSEPRADAYEKVTGQTKFAADYFGENFVWAGVKRAGVPHGRLKTVDVSRATELPGVLAVLTH